MDILNLKKIIKERFESLQNVLTEERRLYFDALEKALKENVSALIQQTQTLIASDLMDLKGKEKGE